MFVLFPLEVCVCAWPSALWDYADPRLGGIYRRPVAGVGPQASGFNGQLKCTDSCWLSLGASEDKPWLRPSGKTGCIRAAKEERTILNLVALSNEASIWKHKWWYTVYKAHESRLSVNICVICSGMPTWDLALEQICKISIHCCLYSAALWSSHLYNVVEINNSGTLFLCLTFPSRNVCNA